MLSRFCLASTDGIAISTGCSQILILSFFSSSSSLATKSGGMSVIPLPFPYALAVIPDPKIPLITFPAKSYIGTE